MKKISLSIIISLALLSAAVYVIKKGALLETRNIVVAPPISEMEKERESQQEAAVTPEVKIDDTQDAATQKPTINIEERPVVNDKKAETKSAEKVNVNEAPDGSIVSRLVSWGFQKSSNRKIDTVIVHTSYNSLGGDVYDADRVIDIYKQYEVSAHYLILRDGTIYQLVSDQNISWHAGEPKMPDGRKNVNDFSIGIEVINTKDGKFTDDQYTALNSLIATLKKKYPVKFVLGHDEIAPERKTDPWGIEWDSVNK